MGDKPAAITLAENVPEKRTADPPPAAIGPKLAPEAKGFFSPLFTQLAPAAVGLAGPGAGKGKDDKRSQGEGMPSSESLTLAGHFEAGDKAFMAFHNDQWEGPFSIEKLKDMHFLQPDTWICRAGSQMVMQAYEAPELRTLLNPS